MRAFLGSVKILTKSSILSGCRVLRTGNRPKNSGMRPYVAKSAVVRPFKGVGDVSAVVVGVIGGRGRGAPNPIDYMISFFVK